MKSGTVKLGGARVRKRTLLWMLLFAAAALAVGGLAGYLISDSLRTTYPLLRKSALNPPDWVFPAVWTALYVLMGAAMGAVWTARTEEAPLALALWCAQLGANFLWSILFFRLGLHLPALVWLGLLWALIAAMTAVFGRVNRLIAYSQAPYLLWTAFAGYLNYAVWALN